MYTYSVLMNCRVSKSFPEKARSLAPGKWIPGNISDILSDGARLKVEDYTKNRTYQRPFTNALRARLVGCPGPSLPPEINWIWDWHRCNFLLSWRGWNLRLSVLSNHQYNSSLTHSTLSSPFPCKFEQIMRPISSKSRDVPTPSRPSHGSASGYTLLRSTQTL